MRYAVIETENNQWIYDGDSMQDALEEYRSLVSIDVQCILLRVLVDSNVDGEVDRPVDKAEGTTP